MTQLEEGVEQQRSLIEAKVNLDRAAEIGVARQGFQLVDMVKLFEAAKWMSMAKYSIPPYLRGNPWDCVDVLMRAQDWGFNPYAVARQTYIVESKKRPGDVQMAYMSQLVHAVVLARAPAIGLKNRLEAEWTGEGDERRCTVKGDFGDGKARDYKTPTLGELRKKARQGGEDGEGGKGSPLWYDDPDQQLFYRATTRWARRWAPEILMGVYTEADMEEAGYKQIEGEPAKPVEEDGGLMSRLSASALAKTGFDPIGVMDALSKVGVDEKADASDIADGVASAHGVEPKAQAQSPAGEAPQVSSPAPTDPPKPSRGGKRSPPP